MLRPDWDATWMMVADVLASRSKCTGRRIGAVIATPDNAQIVVGYNGPPAGLEIAGGSGCTNWCPRAASGAQSLDYGNCTSVHAEANALIKADRSRIAGATLYVTSSCCWDCGKMVSNSGITRVVMRLDDERDAHRNPARTISFMESCGLEIVIWRN